MSDEKEIPDQARNMLSQHGRSIDFSDGCSLGLVDLSRTKVDNDDLQSLVFYPGISKLNLEGTTISDAGMVHVGKMQHLESLNVDGTLVSDSSLAKLLELTRLERLNLGCAQPCSPAGQRPMPVSAVLRNRITNRGLAVLVDCISLRRLNLQATHVNDRGLLHSLPEMPGLQRLTLSYLDITDHGIDALESLKWLVELRLEHTAISSDAMIRLMSSKVHSLRDLDLSNTVVSDATLAAFPADCLLQELRLIDTVVSDAGCQHLSQYKSLQNLRLDYTQVTDDGVRELAACGQLRNLELFRTKVSDTCLVWLSDLWLEHLGLGYTDVTDVGMPDAAEFPALKSLDLRGTKLTDRGLRHLVQSSSLEQLFLDHTSITGEGLRCLIGGRLQSLSLHSRIGDDGLQVLANCPSLVRLAVRSAGASDWRPLAELQQLEVLLIDDEVADLSPLQSLRNLKYLLLWGDRFSAASLARLRLALPDCQIATYEPKMVAWCDFRKLCPYG
ncbi:leucine-rich repeat domain-containing protein [Aeoliella mucimassa]|uniref:Leucine Rich repeats (2 copies) n=1 Tax=Aeoliella mucimassa TaxID=2527972 RepID=A0A518AHS1_9BACT|nr:hypothetical protein [Aeoliella mucimassa]QDU54278.1 Leucine Rich repeats (2 copies) [Aeoliella mucimassa]